MTLYPLNTMAAGEVCISLNHIYISMVSLHLKAVVENIVTFLFPITGVYVSKSSYVRPGEHSLDGFYKPYHTVVFYRYLRFFADGMLTLFSCSILMCL